MVLSIPWEYNNHHDNFVWRLHIKCNAFSTSIIVQPFVRSNIINIFSTPIQTQLSRLCRYDPPLHNLKCQARDWRRTKKGVQLVWKLWTAEKAHELQQKRGQLDSGFTQFYGIFGGLWLMPNTWHEIRSDLQRNFIFQLAKKVWGVIFGVWVKTLNEDQVSPLCVPFS